MERAFYSSHQWKRTRLAAHTSAGRCSRCVLIPSRRLRTSLAPAEHLVTQKIDPGNSPSFSSRIHTQYRDTSPWHPTRAWFFRSSIYHLLYPGPLRIHTRCTEYGFRGATQRVLASADVVTLVPVSCLCIRESGCDWVIRRGFEHT
jgi:hypothetical protein